MVKSIIRRVLGALAVILLVSVVTHVAFYLLPGDPAQLACGQNCPPERLAAVRELLRQDEGVASQYLGSLAALVAGTEYGGRVCSAPCLGFSVATGEPVWDLITGRLPVTLSIAAGALALATGLAVVAGSAAAARRDRWIDRALVTTALLCSATPVYVSATLLVLVLCVWLRVLPFPSYVPLSHDPSGWLVNLLLPWLVLAIALWGTYTRLTRAAMIDSLETDHIRAARAAGIPERRLLHHHALRGSLTPLITAVGVDSGMLLGGAVITERLFNMPGLGQLLLQGESQADLPVVSGMLFVMACAVVLANLIADLAYRVVDPRVGVTPA